MRSYSGFVRRLIYLLTLGALLVSMPVLAAPRNPTEKPGPPKSGFYDIYNLSAEFSPGIGQVSSANCTTSTNTQPSIYAANYLVSCSGNVPHNETTLVVDPGNPSHLVGGFHTYQINYLGATVIAHILSTASVSFDGGLNWQEVPPPITPFQFTGDPALAFDGRGRLYFASIADHEGPGGYYTGPSAVVAYSGDGGLTWTNPVVVGQGLGALDPLGQGPLVFQDKEFIAADQSSASPYKNRVYLSWTSFQENFSGIRTYSRSPIMLSYSDDGLTWSKPVEISGFNPACSVQWGGGAASQCDEDQFSYPTVAPDGTVYVTFENFNTPNENQTMLVSSSDGGVTWTSPVRVETVYDVNFPMAFGRSTLTGCQFRVSSVENSAADPSDPTGKTVYMVWADNRNGSEAVTNSDIFLGRSTDGGLTWATYGVDSAANDQFYPWVAVASDGRVDVGYMDRSYSASQSVCQYGFSLSRVSFQANGQMTLIQKTRVNSGLSDPGHSRWFSGATGAQSTFLGDYNAIAVGSNGATWSLWTDMRNTVANPPSPTRNHDQQAVAGKTP